MNAWNALSGLATTLIVAALAWSAGIGAAVPHDAAAESSVGSSSSYSSPPLMLGWAQAVDDQGIQQVGEDTGADEEPLDQGPPPAQEGADAEPLDAGQATGAQDEDIELLDQGSPPGSVPVTTVAGPGAAAPVGPAVSEPVAAAPAPAPASGPSLPAGFGTGQVHVSTGAGGFPRGLESCHVGAVTGRAYVGVNCGNGDSFVGHAPTFEDFPFVTPEDFPFDPDSRLLVEENFPFDENPVVMSSRGDGGSNDVIVVAAGRATGNAAIESMFGDTTRSRGNDGVALAQRARDREPGARGHQEKARKRANRDDGSVASADTKEKQSKAGKKDRSKAKEKQKGKKERSKAKSERQEQKAKGQHAGKKPKHSSGKRENRRAKR